MHWAEVELELRQRFPEQVAHARAPWPWTNVCERIHKLGRSLVAQQPVEENRVVTVRALVHATVVDVLGQMQLEIWIRVLESIPQRLFEPTWASFVVQGMQDHGRCCLKPFRNVFGPVLLMVSGDWGHG